MSMHASSGEVTSGPIQSFPCTHTVEVLRVVDWCSGNIRDSALSYIIGAVAVGLNLGRTLKACGRDKCLCAWTACVWALEYTQL